MQFASKFICAIFCNILKLWYILYMYMRFSHIPFWSFSPSGRKIMHATILGWLTTRHGNIKACSIWRGLMGSSNDELLQACTYRISQKSLYTKRTAYRKKFILIRCSKKLSKYIWIFFMTGIIKLLQLY